MEQVSRGFGAYNLDSAFVRRDTVVAEFFHPAVPRFANDFSEGVADETLRASLPLAPDIDEDRRFEATFLLGEISGLDELFRRIPPAPIPPREQRDHRAIRAFANRAPRRRRSGTRMNPSFPLNGIGLARTRGFLRTQCHWPRFAHLLLEPRMQSTISTDPTIAPVDSSSGSRLSSRASFSSTLREA